MWVSACDFSHHVVAQPVGTTAQDASCKKGELTSNSKRLLCYTAMSDSFKKKHLGAVLIVYVVNIVKRNWVIHVHRKIH